MQLKKIIYIHQYFKTPKESGAIRSLHISKGMVDQGMYVDMITSHNKSNYELNIIDGVNVHFIPVNYSNKLTFVNRYFAFFSFVFAAIKLIQKLPKADLCYATSTPLTVGIIALWIKWINNIPYIFEVRDLWPEAPIQLGIIKSPILKYISILLEKTIYENSNKIVALSPGIEQGILQKYQKAKILVVPNLADIDYFGRSDTELQENKNFVIGYFGTFGLANHLEYILEIALECQKMKLSILFMLVGDGAKKNDLVQKATEMKLENVQILPHQNRTEIKSLLRKTDACVTSFLDIPILETNSPNKFFDGLAAGKLSIVNTKGWLRELVEKNECGIYYDPKKPETFPNLIGPFIKDKKLLESYQANGLRLAKSEFSKNKLAEQICSLILS